MAQLLTITCMLLVLSLFSVTKGKECRHKLSATQIPEKSPPEPQEFGFDDLKRRSLRTGSLAWMGSRNREARAGEKNGARESHFSSPLLAGLIRRFSVLKQVPLGLLEAKSDDHVLAEKNI